MAEVSCQIGLTDSSENWKKKRSGNWSEKEMCILLDLWRGNVDDLRRMKRNKTIYEKMARDFAVRKNSQYSRMWTEIHTKIKNLTAKYRDEISKIGTSGGNPSTWIFFSTIHAIIGRYPAQDVTHMHESCTNVNANFTRSPERSQPHLDSVLGAVTSNEAENPMQSQNERSLWENDCIPSIQNIEGELQPYANSQDRNNTTVTSQRKRRKTCCSLEKMSRSYLRKCKGAVIMLKVWK